jgi:hypothetical protein
MKKTNKNKMKNFKKKHLVVLAFLSSNKCKRKNAKGGQTNGDIRYILWAGINLLTTTYNVIIMEER